MDLWIKQKKDLQLSTSCPGTIFKTETDSVIAKSLDNLLTISNIRVILKKNIFMINLSDYFNHHNFDNFNSTILQKYCLLFPSNTTPIPFLGKY